MSFLRYYYDLSLLSQGVLHHDFDLNLIFFIYYLQVFFVHPFYPTTTVSLSPFSRGDLKSTPTVVC